jgi:hypothetical protein
MQRIISGGSWRIGEWAFHEARLDVPTIRRMRACEEVMMVGGCIDLWM